MTQKSPSLRARIRGPMAWFTRPELKVERVRYEVMTPSAAQGVLPFPAHAGMNRP